jgi:hypothetical protein
MRSLGSLIVLAKRVRTQYEPDSGRLHVRALCAEVSWARIWPVAVISATIAALRHEFKPTPQAAVVVGNHIGARKRQSRRQGRLASAQRFA